MVSFIAAALLLLGQSSTNEETAARIAAGLSRNLPQTMTPDIRWVAARSEQSTIIFTFSVRQNASVSNDPEVASAWFLPGFCADPVIPQLLRAGIRFRLDTQVAEWPVAQGRVIDRCDIPAPVSH